MLCYEPDVNSSVALGALNGRIIAGFVRLILHICLATVPYNSSPTLQCSCSSSCAATDCRSTDFLATLKYLTRSLWWIGWVAWPKLELPIFRLIATNISKDNNKSLEETTVA